MGAMPKKISGAFATLKKIGQILQGAWDFLIKVQIKGGIIVKVQLCFDTLICN